jgi:radical SAM protein (TIGR01212 family)
MNYYYSLNDYFKKTYGEKIYKIAIDAGLSCPNRDGKIDTRGCIFCSAGGSGDFAVSRKDFPTVSMQIEAGISLFSGKNVGNRFIAYFQAYTNTYGPLEYLERIFSEALSHHKIAGISIATRPDCLGDEVLSLLATLKEKYPDKFIWIELGLQTIHEDTALYIRRGYPLTVFEKALLALNALNIPVIVHVILGLPGESRERILDTIDYLAKKDIWGIKLQLLHILKGTDLAKDYEKNLFSVYTKEEYIDLVIDCIEHLPKDVVLHRVTGDGPKNLLIAPLWSGNKKDVLNSLHHRFKERGAYQGRLFL